MTGQFAASAGGVCGGCARQRLGWAGGILNGNGSKPKGMHWRTYWRLYTQHNQAQGEVLAGITTKLGLVRNRLGDLDL